MILPINPLSYSNTQINFGYRHPLKTLWKKGQLPTVVKGLYGDTLTQANVSLEHLVPFSKGGNLRYENLALASKAKNCDRGNSPITNFLTSEMAKQYLDQFKNIKIKNIFYGSTYINGIKKTLEKLGIKFS